MNEGAPKNLRDRALAAVEAEERRKRRQAEEAQWERYERRRQLERQLGAELRNALQLQDPLVLEFVSQEANGTQFFATLVDGVPILVVRGYHGGTTYNLLLDPHAGGSTWISFQSLVDLGELLQRGVYVLGGMRDVKDVVNHVARLRK